ncbi:hypothetical protein [Lentzea sp. E54]
MDAGLLRRLDDLWQPCRHGYAQLHTSALLDLYSPELISAGGAATRT